MRKLLLLFLLAAPCQAGPKHIAKSFGQQVKKTFYSDVKAHPYAWGLNHALQWGIAFADTGSTCAIDDRRESGPAHYFVGRAPSCHKLVTLTAGMMFMHSLSENWLANSFKDSCDRDAANPDSKWWKVESHTKSTAACYWGPPLADSLVLGAYEIPVIKSNVRNQ